MGRRRRQPAARREPKRARHHQPAGGSRVRRKHPRRRPGGAATAHRHAHRRHCRLPAVAVAVATTTLPAPLPLWPPLPPPLPTSLPPRPLPPRPPSRPRGRLHATAPATFVIPHPHSPSDPSKTGKEGGWQGPGCRPAGDVDHRRKGWWQRPVVPAARGQPGGGGERARGEGATAVAVAATPSAGGSATARRGGRGGWWLLDGEGVLTRPAAGVFLELQATCISSNYFGDALHPMEECGLRCKLFSFCRRARRRSGPRLGSKVRALFSIRSPPRHPACVRHAHGVCASLRGPPRAHKPVQAVPAQAPDHPRAASFPSSPAPPPPLAPCPFPAVCAPPAPCVAHAGPVWGCTPSLEILSSLPRHRPCVGYHRRSRPFPVRGWKRSGPAVATPPNPLPPAQRARATAPGRRARLRPRRDGRRGAVPFHPRPPLPPPSPPPPSSGPAPRRRHERSRRHKKRRARSTHCPRSVRAGVASSAPPQPRQPSPPARTPNTAWPCARSPFLL